MIGIKIRAKNAPKKANEIARIFCLQIQIGGVLCNKNRNLILTFKSVIEKIISGFFVVFREVKQWQITINTVRRSGRKTLEANAEQKQTAIEQSVAHYTSKTEVVGSARLWIH